jgi:predicted DNA-binding transcriptional regulator AlpA
MKNNRKIVRDRQAIKKLARAYWRAAYTDARIFDVVGIADMVSLSGFTKGSMYVFSTRDDFPAPVARKGKTLFWRRDDFETWLKRKRKTPGSSPPR